MRKKVILFCFILFVSIASVFADDPVTFYKQMPGMFLVDLSSKSYPSHSSSVSWGGNSEDYYNDDVIICVLGIRNATNDVTISAELSSGDWAYRLDPSDSSISRPFGIDLILRGHSTSAGTDVTIQYKSSNVVHLGIQSTSSSSGDDHSFTIPYEKDTDSENYTVGISSFDQNSVWMDVCLVLPELNDDGTITLSDGTKYIAKSSDTQYNATLTLIISGGGLSAPETYVLNLSGLYSKDGDVSTTSEILTVTPTAAAKSIEIETGTGDSAKFNTNDITVATYSFGTKSYNIDKVSYASNSSYIYLSSGSAGDEFKLKLEKTNGQYYSDSDYGTGNSVPFTATIESHYYGSVTFDGTITSSTYTGNSLEITPTEMTAQTGGGSWVRWYDDGEIQITINPGTQSVKELSTGKYSATIYVNVVCAY